MADDDDSSSLSSISSLSSLSPAPSDDECEVQLKPQDGILKFFHKLPQGQTSAPKKKKKEMSPPAPKRPPSPPHEYVLADNPDIAFIVMFRSRFNDAFPKTLSNFGPQELEQEVVDQPPGDRVEYFLCALLGLLLNRKQDVKPGHYNRALEEAIQTHKAQWPKAWQATNPLAGGATFATMIPTERLTLLRTLVMWTLQSSEAVRSIIAKAYKQNRHDDDLNQPLSVQPWGSDSDKRRFFLIEGLDDTAFRVYRESNPAGFSRTWWSVAGSIDELKALAEKLETVDGGPKAAKFAQRITLGVPRFEAGEEKRRRREYRILRKQQFKRPEPGFSVYEGRTRGKRIKYTYSDDEDFLTDSSNWRSTRNTRAHTPADTGPVTTASGRQIRAPNRLNGETRSSATGSRQPSVDTGLNDDFGGEDLDMQDDAVGAANGRPRRSAAVHHGLNGWSSSKGKKEHEYDSAAEEEEEEDDDDDDDDDDGSDPDLGNDEEGDEHVPDQEEEEDEEEFEEDEGMVGDEDLGDDGSQGSIMVRLPVKASVERGKVVQWPKDAGAAEKGVDSAPRRSAGDATKAEPTAAAPEKPQRHDSAAARVSPGPPQEVISVAVRTTAATPEPPADMKAEAEDTAPVSSSAGSAGEVPTSLALRGSPEKPVQQHVPNPINVGYGE